MTRSDRAIRALFVQIGRLEAKASRLAFTRQLEGKQASANVLKATESDLRDAWRRMTDAGLVD